MRAVLANEVNMRVSPLPSSDHGAIAPLSSASSLRFPSAWLWLLDETIPAYVKAKYSPRESWKDKPFSKEDARFFFKGVNELSELFTDERSRRGPEYFRHPRFRSSYLLYFLPLQAAKFITLLQLHQGALEAALALAKQDGAIRALDLGAGPGTASIALLLTLLDPPPALRPLVQSVAKLPIELEWWDTDRAVMEDGKALALALGEGFPALRGRVAVRSNVGNWWGASSSGSGQRVGLTFLGHVLNEASGPAGGGRARDSKESGETEDFRELRGRAETPIERVWRTLLARAGGGGTLILEPAMRRASQQLSQLRDQLLEGVNAVPWGPCLHAGKCPLATGRDWCHFSVPLRIPGEWFREFSKGLGSERSWLKFSYLWLASPEFPAPVAPPGLRRVISDPLRAPSANPRARAPAFVEVLTCEPEHPGRARVSGAEPLHRGDLIGR